MAMRFAQCTLNTGIDFVFELARPCLALEF